MADPRASNRCFRLVESFHTSKQPASTRAMAVISAWGNQALTSVPRPLRFGLLCEAVRRAHQLVRYPGLEGGVAGVGDNAQLGFRPRAVQLPSNPGLTEHIVAAVDDNGGDVANATDV